MSYLTTLRRIPDDVILSMATREFQMYDPPSCICGWAMREDLLAATGSQGGGHSGPVRCAARFGGTEQEWGAIFGGVTDTYGVLPRIEMAFVRRVDEAVQRAS